MERATFLASLDANMQVAFHHFDRWQMALCFDGPTAARLARSEKALVVLHWGLVMFFARRYLLALREEKRAEEQRAALEAWRADAAQYWAAWDAERAAARAAAAAEEEKDDDDDEGE